MLGHVYHITWWQWCKDVAGQIRENEEARFEFYGHVDIVKPRLGHHLHTCQHLKVRKQNTRYCEGAKRPSPREGSSRGGEGVGGGCPPSHGRELLHFWTSNYAIWCIPREEIQAKIYCIAWKATNLKIPKTECSVFWGFKNFKNGTVLLKTEWLASLHLCRTTPPVLFFGYGHMLAICCTLPRLFVLQDSSCRNSKRNQLKKLTISGQ